MNVLKVGHAAWGWQMGFCGLDMFCVQAMCRPVIASVCNSQCALYPLFGKYLGWQVSPLIFQCEDATAGSEINFLCWRQLATRQKFSVAR